MVACASAVRFAFHFSWVEDPTSRRYPLGSVAAPDTSPAYRWCSVIQLLRESGEKANED